MIINLKTPVQSHSVTANINTFIEYLQKLNNKVSADTGWDFMLDCKYAKPLINHIEHIVI